MSLITTAKAQLKKIPWLFNAKRWLWHRFFDFTRLNLIESFPLYRPNNAGPYGDLASLTVLSINQTIPALNTLAASLRLRRVEVENIVSAAAGSGALQSAADLKRALDAHGSDKAVNHNYHYLYGMILKGRAEIRMILEFGLGTNNPDVVSNMGVSGKPGASLRAFRDFLPAARIYGADIDRRILFSEERIQTFFVDQTDPATFKEMAGALTAEFDLIIDDGLHSINANLMTLTFGLPYLRAGGWLVVEDIALEALPAWEVVVALMSDRYEAHIFKAVGSLVFAVKRLG